MAFVVVGLIAVWGTLWWVETRKTTAANHPAPSGLFDELCRAHNLTAEERGLIRKAAADQQQPGTVFIDPAVIDRYALSNPDAGKACQSLRDKLFGPSAAAQAV